MAEINIENILSSLATLRRAVPPASISFAQLEEWVSSDDLEVIGAILHHLDNKEISEKISPPVSQDWYVKTFLRYTRRCLIEDPKGEWCDSRYEAGWNFTSWFKFYWKITEAKNSIFKDAKSLISTIYKNGDEPLRLCIVNSILEHLFEDSSIVSFFSDWIGDPILNIGYNEALCWGNENKL